MKRYLILITIAFSFFTYSFGQSTTFNDVTKKTTIKDNDGVIVHDVDANYSYGVLWQDIAAYMFSKSNTVSGAFNFTNSITLPSSLDAGLTNGIGFQDGDFAWSDGNGDGLFYGASKAWVLSVIPDSIDLGDVDLSAYASKAGSNAFSGSNTYSNVNDFRTGSLYLPYKTSLSALSGTQSLYVYSDGTVRASVKNSTNDKYDLILADRDWVTANFSVVSGFIKSTGTQTGITVSPSMSSGKWTFGTSSQFVLTPQNQGSSPTWVNGRIYTKAGTEAARVYMNYEDQDYNHLTTYAPNVEEVQDLIDANYSYNAPTASSAAIDTLNFSADRNFVDKIYTIPSGGITLRFNSDYGSVKVIMKGTNETVTFDAGTSTIKWVGGEAPSIAYASTTNKYWALVFERISSTEIIGSWIWAQ